jgi:hypothetical protein
MQRANPGRRHGSNIEKDVLHQMNDAHDDKIDKYASTHRLARVRAQISKFRMRIVGLEYIALKSRDIARVGDVTQNLEPAKRYLYRTLHHSKLKRTRFMFLSKALRKASQYPRIVRSRLT